MTATPRRITLLIHSLNGGGAERQITSLANHLSMLGHHGTLVTLDNPSNDRYTVNPNVPRVGLNGMNQSGSILSAISANRSRIRAVRAAIQQSKPDCVISFCDKMNIVALAACRPLSIPIIISERSDPRRQKLGWLWESARRWYYPTSSACVVQTKATAAYLRPILGKNPHIAVIASGIEPPVTTIPDRMFVVNKPCTLLYVGRLSKEKGPDRLIQTWSEIAKKHPLWKLVFAGDGPLEASLRQMSQTTAVESQVEFLGWQRDVWPLLASADAFVLPSQYEGFPNALLEAMYSGLPVVATDCSESIREIVEQDRNGLIAQNNVASLTNEIDRLLSDTSLQQQLGTAARRTAVSYLWSQKISQWTTLIEHIIQRKIMG